MIKKLIIAAALTAATAGYAFAGPTDFYAAPVNAGPPTNLPGETIIPGLSQALVIVNGVTQPVLQPLLAPAGGAAPAAVVHHHHHHHHHHHKKA